MPRHVLTSEERSRGGKARAAQIRAAKAAREAASAQPPAPPSPKPPDKPRRGPDLERIKWSYDPADFAPREGETRKGKQYFETEYIILKRDGVAIRGKIRYYGESLEGLRYAIFAQNGNIASGDVYAVLYEGSDDFEWGSPGFDDDLGSAPDYDFDGD